ncbi:MAG: SIMPL domain-containing protein [Campylobacterota bacterium]|nr:SIMPL domain-containing protein [Campylobacterota bacterium]
MNMKSSTIISLGLVLGLTLLGYLLGGSIIKYKELDRTVTVKGLAQKEVKADTVIWPIKYIVASNDIDIMYKKLEKDTKMLNKFLLDYGFSKNEITISAPKIIDKFTRDYGNQDKIKFRYSGTQVMTLYTSSVDKARDAMREISNYGKKGVIFSSNNYSSNVEYIYTKLNDIKPQMIDNATQNARQVAKKFAVESSSKLGKIKNARQGQFSISQRDKNTPFIKKVRIVSTIEYYLVD